MRFLVDECTGPTVARWLREHEHKVDVMRQLIASYADRLADQCVVVTETRVRFAGR